MIKMRGSLHYTIWTLLLSLSWVSASENFELFRSENQFREVYGLTLDRILPLLNAGITERRREFREEFVDPPCNATTVAEARRLNDDAVCYGEGKDDPTKSLIPFQSLNLPDCDPGWYCPNVCPGVPGGDAQICAPNKKCLLDRLVTRHCPPQGVFEPSLCEPGFFCPTPRLTVPCPAGNNCPRGSDRPKRCPFMSYCPARSSKRVYYGGMVISGIIDVILFAMIYILKRHVEPRNAKKRLYASHTRNQGVANGTFVSLEMSPLSAVDVDSPGDAKIGTFDTSSISPYRNEQIGISSNQTRGRRVLEEGFRRCNQGRRFNISFTGLTLTLPSPINKTILSDASGEIRSGRVAAIMGPSGAGKTTLLSVLTGQYSKTGGVLRINGMQDPIQRHQKVIGFVPQDDTMLQELTVRENIRYSALIRLPRTMSKHEVEEHIDAIIEVLGLQECQDALSSSVSGGQRKRTNIGMELAAAPSVLFLDEPTSGLDATAALEVCRTLKAISALDVTVACVIHQPRAEIFSSFDDLILLGPGGVTVYAGPQTDVIPYFSNNLGLSLNKNSNPADDIIDFIAGMMPGGTGEKANLPDNIQRCLEETNTINYKDSQDPNSPSEDNSYSRSLSHSGTEGLIGSPISKTSDYSQLTQALISRKHSENLFNQHAVALSRYWTVMGSSLVHGDLSQKLSPATTPPDEFEDSSYPKSTTGSFQLSFQGDLYPERGLSWWGQTILFHERSILQQYRQVSSFLLEIGVALIAGGTMGAAALVMPSLYMGVYEMPYTFLSPAPLETFLPSLAFYIVLAIGLAASPAGVRTFGEERNVFQREYTSGYSASAYYLAKTISVLYRLTIGAIHFAAIFHFLTKATMSYMDLLLVVWMEYFCVYGLAAVVSMLVKRENSALLGVIASLIAGCLCGYGPSLRQGREWGVLWLQDISYARWGSEAFFHLETLHYREKYMVSSVSAPMFGYTMDRLAMDISIMMSIGAILRISAFFLMVLLNTKKTR